MKNKIISILAALIISLPLAAQVKKAKTAKPAETPVVKEVLDRSIRPAGAEAPVIKIGDYQSFELPNGLKVFVVENHNTPRTIAGFEIFVKVGSYRKGIGKIVIVY